MFSGGVGYDHRKGTDIGTEGGQLLGEHATRTQQEGHKDTAAHVEITSHILS